MGRHRPHFFYSPFPETLIYEMKKTNKNMENKMKKTTLESEAAGWADWCNDMAENSWEEHQRDLSLGQILDLGDYQYPRSTVFTRYEKGKEIKIKSGLCAPRTIIIPENTNSVSPSFLQGLLEDVIGPDGLLMDGIEFEGDYDISPVLAEVIDRVKMQRRS